MITIGDIQIHIINEGTMLVDSGGAYGLVPRKLWQAYSPYNDNNQVPMSQNVLLVKANGKNILVDAGLGDRLTPRQHAMWTPTEDTGGILGGLARLGLSAADIDLVINTHLHLDHAGGNTTFDPDGNIVARYPNAEYITQRREYQDASNPNERTRATYLIENFQPLLDNGQMRLIDGDANLMPGIRAVLTPGHTPGHMSIIFESGGEHAMFACDMATFAVHFERLAWMTAYDVEPLVTLESKRRWQRWALETNAIMMFPHDPTRPAGKLTEDANGRPQLISIDEAFV